MHTPAEIEELRRHYDGHDTADELAAAIDSGAAVWDTETRTPPVPAAE